MQIQKPGLKYAASVRDWSVRFDRTIKDGARPLVILWPFGPVAFVFDVKDTKGPPLPTDVYAFVATGAVDDAMLHSIVPGLNRRRIEVSWVDAGDGNAGSIRILHRSNGPKDASVYRIHINKNHRAPTKFATMAHELGHLALGHLGPDKRLRIPQRPKLSHAQVELEAESVAYIVCARNRVASRSKTYLANFVKEDTTLNDMDVYQVMRAAGRVEDFMGIAARHSFDLRRRGGQEELDEFA